MGTVRTQLVDDHARLAALLDRAGSACASAEWPQVQEAWDALEAGLLAHLDAEERHLIPALETSHPDEMGLIRREHERFRTELLDLGVRSQIHTLRKEEVDRFCDELREHAAREDRMLYRWADEITSAETRRSLLSFLESERVRRLAMHRRRPPPAHPAP